MRPDGTPTRLLTLREAADEYAIGLRRLRTAVREGEIRAIRPGARRARARVFAADVTTCLEALRDDPDPNRPGVISIEARIRHVLRRIRSHAEKALDHGKPLDVAAVLDLANDALSDEEGGS